MRLLSDRQAKWFVVRSLATNPWYRGRLAYIVEAQQWAIRYVGEQITAALSKETDLKARVTASPWALTRTIIHFGSLHTVLQKGTVRRRFASNQHVVSIFHLIPRKATTNLLPAVAHGVAAIHTSCRLTREQLVAQGVPGELIHVIPLGVDRALFRAHTAEEAQRMRRQLNIPPHAFVIGSFQKDGIGWQAGNEPKLEKGPDIFVRVVSELAKVYPIHVLLLGPARGYVERALRQRGVNFTSVGAVRNVAEVAPYYAALDLYLISSRIEGGPLTLLEAWASGVPVVSTAVGMVPDVAVDGETALVASVGDVDQFTGQVARLIGDVALQQRLRAAGLRESKQYEWSNIAQRYFHELYEPLLPHL